MISYTDNTGGRACRSLIPFAHFDKLNDRFQRIRLNCATPAVAELVEAALRVAISTGSMTDEGTRLNAMVRVPYFEMMASL